MKKITLFTLLTFTTFAFSQEELTHSITQYSSDGEMVNNYKEEYTYDSNGNNIKIDNYFWDELNAVWNFNDETTYAYNTNNLLTEEVYSYSGEPTYKTTYEYNTEGALLNIKSYSYESSVWVLDGVYTLTYEDGLLVSYIDESESGVYKNEFNYNINNLLESIYDSELVDDVYVSEYRSIYSYNANNSVSMIENDYYNGNSWEDDGSISYEYDADGNVILEEEVYGAQTYTETYSYDTDFPFSDFYHPFKDTTGLDYLFDVTKANHKNKLVSSTSNGDSVTTYYYDEATASADEFSLSEVAVFPNPVVDYLNIQVDKMEVEKVEIYNVIGKKISTSFEMKLDVSNYKEGVYFVKVLGTKGEVASKKIVKE